MFEGVGLYVISAGVGLVAVVAAVMATRNVEEFRRLFRDIRAGNLSILGGIHRVVRAIWRRYIVETRRRNVRVRSEEELNARATGLGELADVLDTLGCYWHVSGGTALGVARDGDFIPWDWDIGVAVRQEEFRDLWPSFVDQAQLAGFMVKLVRTRTDDNNEKILLKKYEQEFEVLFWTLQGDYRTRKICRRPARFYESTENRELRGRVYPFPYPLEEYVEAVYGEDWRVPKRTADRRAYFNQETLMLGD